MNTQMTRCEIFNKLGFIIGAFEYDNDADHMACAARSVAALDATAKIFESLPTVRDGQPVLKIWVTSFRYEVFDRHAQKVVGKPYLNRQRASRRVDKLDNEYGAYRYTVRSLEVPVTKTNF